MTTTRQVDEFGNVSYAVLHEDGSAAGVVHKTCGGWRAELPGNRGWAPARSVTAGMEWLAWMKQELAEGKNR